MHLSKYTPNARPPRWRLMHLSKYTPNAKPTRRRLIYLSKYTPNARPPRWRLMHLSRYTPNAKPTRWRLIYLSEYTPNARPPRWRLMHLSKYTSNAKPTSHFKTHHYRYIISTKYALNRTHSAGRRGGINTLVRNERLVLPSLTKLLDRPVNINSNKMRLHSIRKY